MTTTVDLDEGQIWLIGCLNASLEPDLDRRSAAEEALKQASVQQGYGVALAKVTVNKDVQLGLRQLAAVLLKQFVKQHWQEGEKHYLPPTASSQDKAAIRCLLPPALEDPHGKIRTAVGMAIASIAVHDWPQDWPDLMHFLVACISAQGNTNRVHGALRCLSLFASDLDDAQLPSLVPVLFPPLHGIISSTEYEPGMRRRALIILHSCIATLGVMSGVYQTETRNLMAPMLKSWMDQFAQMLSPPVPAEDPQDWSLRVETLKCLLHIVHNFSKLASSELPVVLGPLWGTVVSGLKVYESACIQGVEESYADLADSDGSDQSLETLIIQLFEFLLALVGSPRFSKVVQEHIGDLVYYTIGYMQMTEEQVQTWSTDPNQYVADEDDVTYSCRVSGILLLEELVVTFEDRALKLIFDVVQRRIDEASKAKALGQPDWWKLREASILAFGSVADSLIEAQEKGSGAFQLEAFLESILLEDLSAGVEVCPFLHGRGLWAAAKFASLINAGKAQQFLYAAMEGLNFEAPAPIKVGSCRALSELFPRVDSGVLRPHLGTVFSALAKLLQEASDETLHLVLETMQSAVGADEQASAAVEPTISPLVLNIWAQHVHDPLIGIDALEILEAIRDVPGCREPLTHRVLPFLSTILANPRPQAEGLVAGALDLLTMLLKNAPTELVRAVHDATYGAVCNLIMRSDDHAELQNGSECLAAIVKGGGEALLEWSGDPHGSMKLLLDAAARLLHPQLDDSASLFVGSFITSLVMQLSTQMAPHVRELISALVSRLETAQIMGLKSSLLLVFARLVHVSAPNVAQFIDLLLNVPAKGFDNALAFVMTEWTKHQGDIQGAYQIKVSTIALALLLASGHPQLGNIYVQGRLMKPASSRIVTRSRAKTAPDQWTSVPLPPKILSLLADVLVEMQEQSAFGMVEDNDWEEVGDESDEELETEQVESTILNRETSVFKPLEDMEHLLNEEVEEGDFLEDAYAATDPINQINLAAYLVDFIKQFADKDRASFESLCQNLSEGEKIAVQSALSR